MLDLQKIYPQQLNESILIDKICYNTADITPTSCFVALSGTKVDGHSFARVAQDNGAKAIIVEKIQEGISIPQIIVHDTHVTLSKLSHELYNRTLDFDIFKIIGITGTDGKTSTATIIQELLTKLHKNIGYIGTNGIFYNGEEINLHCTTPLAPELHELIHDMNVSKVDMLAMEVSSHALATKRVEDLRYSYAVFTNLSHDHLDFHKTFENYKKSKFHLFDLMTSDGLAIVSIDDKAGAELVQILPEDTRVKTTSLENNGADMYAQNITYSLDGMQFDLWYKGMCVTLTSHILGDFNISNLMSAILIASDLGYDLNDIYKIVPALSPIKGRMELLKASSKNIGAIVDFGHAPHAIESVLKFVRNLNPSRLTVITGAVGDGDVTKRPEMAENALKYSDRFIATMDNPYSEPADKILNELVKELPEESYIKIEGRQAAIDYAIDTAQDGEIIVILGRGREDMITNGTERIFLNDYRYTKEKLEKL